MLGLTEVIEARVSAITANVLIAYEAGQATEEFLRSNCESIIGTYSRTAYMSERERKNQGTVNERRLQEAPISEMVTRSVAVFS